MSLILGSTIGQLSILLTIKMVSMGYGIGLILNLGILLEDQLEALSTLDSWPPLERSIGPCTSFTCL